MFNFAVAGSLERYQPFRREPSIQNVNPITKVKDTTGIGAGTDDTNLDVPASAPPIASTNFPLIKGYGSGINSKERKQNRRAWVVSDLMTKSVRALRADDDAATARNLLERTGFRHIPILNEFERVEGLLSDRDLLPFNLESDRARLISTIMTKRVLTCFPETPLRLAAATMLEEGFSSLPVVNQHGVLLGILTTGDILKALVTEAPLDLWA
jgi:CBS domain-containing protein